MTTKRQSTRAAAVAALTVATIVAAAGSSSAATTDRLLLRFDDGHLGAPFTSPVVEGALSSVTTTTVVTDAGRLGRVTATTSSPGQGLAADFPAYSPNGARAVVVVQNTGAVDGMNPGTARLEFGGDLMLDGGTTARSTGSDNGNNAVQRGLYDDPAQFKLEVDAGRPDCRFKGTTGSVLVASRTALVAGTRYRVRCVRAAGSNTVSIAVTPFSSSGALGATVTTTATTPVGTALGAMTFAPVVPLSIGGKVYYSATTRSVRLMGSSDQFNGSIDNAVLRIG